MSEKITGTTVTLAAGDRLSIRGNDVEEVYILLKGKLKAMTSYGEFLLGPGSTVGLCDAYYGMYIFNYFVEEDSTVKKYPITSTADIISILNDQIENLGVISVMQSRFIHDIIAVYNDMNAKCKKKDADYTPDSRIAKWELDKYTSLSSIPTKIALDFLKASAPVGIGTAHDGFRFISTINDACIQMADMLEIDLDYKEEVIDYILAIDEAPNNFFGSDIDVDDDYVISQVEKSLYKIITYAEYEEEDATALIHMLTAYKEPKMQTSSSDEARQLRRDITKEFYKLYEIVFFKAVNDISIPPLILMFLNFGFLDENLLTKESTIDLYKLAVSLESLYDRNNIFTIFMWLREIFWGDKEPSKNAMDMDYAEYIHSEVKSGNMSSSDAEEAMHDQTAKVRFEIANLFQSGNRVVYGRGSTFCPVLTDGGTYRSLTGMIASAERIMAAIDTLKAIDFSAYHREVMYTNKQAGIDREFITKEVLPNVILMPTFGNEGLMWQDIEGRLRDTPARFVLPIFPSNLSLIITQVTGRYRWEYCKRNHGVHWNDVSEPSLTAEYCDYIQFYKKNRLLTDAAKEKVKTMLTSCRNNYREVFVKDYEIWIMNEANASFRLNKVVRPIMARYCPFTRELRDTLKVNPMLAELFSSPSRDFADSLKHIDLVVAAVQKKTGSVPEEILEYQRFLNS